LKKSAPIRTVGGRADFRFFPKHDCGPKGQGFMHLGKIARVLANELRKVSGHPEEYLETQQIINPKNERALLDDKENFPGEKYPSP
jgi:hypothetical protein